MSSDGRGKWKRIDETGNADVKKTDAEFVWKKKRRLILPRVIKDVTREKLAYWSCYASAACLATSTWASAVGWNTVANRIGYFQLIDGFGGSALPYVVAFGSTMMSVWFFVGSFLCLWATATDYRVKFYRILQIYVWIIAASFIVVIILLTLVVVHRCVVLSLFQGDMRISMQAYLNGNREDKQTIDRMQIDTKCCGSSNYTDWWKIGKFNDHVPFSCCNPRFPGPCKFRSMRTTDPTAQTVHQVGCVSALRDQFTYVVADGLIVPLSINLVLIVVLLVPFRYLETSVGSVRDEERMDVPTIGYAWIRTTKVRVARGSKEAQDTLHEEVAYLDQSSGSSSGSDSGDTGSSDEGSGSGGNANKSNDVNGSRLPKGNLNVSAACRSDDQLDCISSSDVLGTSSESFNSERLLASNLSSHVRALHLQNGPYRWREGLQKTMDGRTTVADPGNSSSGDTELDKIANSHHRRLTEMGSHSMIAPNNQRQRISGDVITVKQSAGKALPDVITDGVPDRTVVDDCADRFVIDGTSNSSSWTTVSCETLKRPDHLQQVLTTVPRPPAVHLQASGLVPSSSSAHSYDARRRRTPSAPRLVNARLKSSAPLTEDHISERKTILVEMPATMTRAGRSASELVTRHRRNDEVWSSSDDAVGHQLLEHDRSSTGSRGSGGTGDRHGHPVKYQYRRSSSLERQRRLLRATLTDRRRRDELVDSSQHSYRLQRHAQRNNADRQADIDLQFEQQQQQQHTRRNPASDSRFRRSDTAGNNGCRVVCNSRNDDRGPSMKKDGGPSTSTIPAVIRHHQSAEQPNRQPIVVSAPRRELSQTPAQYTSSKPTPYVKTNRDTPQVTSLTTRNVDTSNDEYDIFQISDTNDSSYIDDWSRIRFPIPTLNVNNSASTTTQGAATSHAAHAVRGDSKTSNPRPSRVAVALCHQDRPVTSKKLARDTTFGWGAPYHLSHASE